jgi:hypothetical protein
MDCAGSDKRYSFNIALSPSERLYIYESAIDAMSHASLDNIVTGNKDAWKRHNRLSLAGTSEAALSFFLNKQKSVNELVFCLDNDTAGRETAADMARKYAGRGFYTRLELPANKDFNMDLTEMIQKSLLKQSPPPPEKQNAPPADRKTADRGER